MQFDELRLRPIGVFHSPFKEPSDTPVQAAGARDTSGTIEIYSEFTEGLLDLSGFSHLIVIYHFHRSGPARLTVTPFLDAAPHGVFATRAPARPNPIGISICRLTRLEGTLLHVKDLDILDGTPVLDLKPYVPAFDHREGVRIGWMEGKVSDLQGKRGDDRFSNNASGNSTNDQ